MTRAKNIFLSVALLSGTIIGAGTFSLPYVFSRSGILFTSILGVLFCCVAIIICYLYADLLHQDGSRHRLAGLARKHFGATGYGVAFFVNILEMFFVLTTYLVLSSSFFALFFPAVPSVYRVILFWVVSTVCVFFTLKKEAFAEGFATVGIVAAIVCIGFLGKNLFFSHQYALVPESFMYMLLPFGSLLFSFGGRSVIPDVMAYHKEPHHKVSRIRISIALGTLLPLVAYGIFIVGIMGLSNGAVSSDAVSGLVGQAPSWAILLLGVLGLLAIWSSYFVIGSDLKTSLTKDLSFSKSIAGVLVIALPFLLYCFGFQNFMYLIGITGGIFTALEWILIIFMWRKVFKKKSGEFFSGNRFILWSIVLLLCVSVFYSVWEIVSGDWGVIDSLLRTIGGYM